MPFRAKSARWGLNDALDNSLLPRPPSSCQAANCAVMLPRVVEGGQAPACVLPTQSRARAVGCVFAEAGPPLSHQQKGMVWPANTNSDPFSPCSPSRLCTSLKHCPKFPAVFGQAYHSSIILTLWLLKVPGSHSWELLFSQIPAFVSDTDICHWKG